jgi:EpsI family protein
LFNFLKSKAAWAATILLLVQAALLYSRPSELIPNSPPLTRLPLSLGSWRFAEEIEIDDETRDILQADDFLYRAYKDTSTGRLATIEVAAFKSLRTGKTPHSPKNCLPGSGWTQLSSDMFPVNVGAAEPIVVNRYIVQHGEDRSLVMYWYQSRERVVASEYAAKLWVMADAIRLNRTDTALVRVVVGISKDDADAATQSAVSFVQAFFAPLRRILPA